MRMSLSFPLFQLGRAKKKNFILHDPDRFSRLVFEVGARSPHEPLKCSLYSLKVKKVADLTNKQQSSFSFLLTACSLNLNS